MQEYKRLTQRDLPPYKFLPGKAPHPEKEGGYLKGTSIDVGDFNCQNFKKNELYLYAIDLYNLGYFWESHVYWEALWNHVGRVGEEADTLKGLIKLAAAGVKNELGQIDAANGHLHRAKELFSQVSSRFVLGIDTKSDWDLKSVIYLQQ